MRMRLYHTAYSSRRSERSRLLGLKPDELEVARLDHLPSAPAEAPAPGDRFRGCPGLEVAKRRPRLRVGCGPTARRWPLPGMPQAGPWTRASLSPELVSAPRTPNGMSCWRHLPQARTR
ncbi:protein associated with ABC transporters [Phyllostomus discolor]|uniref:Protein associated with ABC transporters n=1 Tax=Phyllostomus discolor TaxID=89673 RepID=A0A834A2W7_9CHIR|nr:protein associated with ABC transporters [Phyllostomus discolor]